MLLIMLYPPVDVTISRDIKEQTLTPVCYLYCGTARGPGGLKAWISRHLRKDNGMSTT